MLSPETLGPNVPLPKKLQTALKEAAVDAKAARAPESIMPDNEVTTSNAQKSHLISHDYIIRLRHAGNLGTLSADAQIAAGAAIGLIVPAIEGGYMIYAKRPEVTLVQALSVLFFGIAAAVYIVARRASKKDESVGDICSEIEQRKTTKA